MNAMVRAIITMAGCFLILPALQAAGGEIRIVYWFDKGRPLDTFKFQAYDLRKTEFTPDVERWLSATKAKFPAYEVYTRDVDLSRERGETDKLKIGSAIVREFLIVGDQHGYTFGPYSGPSVGRTEVVQPRQMRPITRSGMPPLNPVMPSTSSPFPFPYPRPHP